MKLRCMCCGYEKEFESGQAAFEAGWDAPPMFTGYVACNLCPGTYVMFGHTAKHAAAHARWEKEGRPEEFEWPRPEDLH